MKRMNARMLGLATIFVLGLTGCADDADESHGDFGEHPDTAAGDTTGSSDPDDPGDPGDPDPVDTTGPADPTTGPSDPTDPTDATGGTDDDDTGIDPDSGPGDTGDPDTGDDANGDPTGDPANCMEIMDELACDAAVNCTWFGAGEFGVCFDEGGGNDGGGDFCGGLDQQTCVQLMGLCMWDGQNCVSGQ